MRRSWRSVEAASTRTPRETFAPAAVVARAVGTLVLEAATHDAGNATPGAVAGCASGVARMVDVALARLVLDALPGRAGAHLDPPRPTAGCTRTTRRAEALWPQRARIPQPAFWSREDVWAPRLVGEAHPPSSGLGALWPRVPDSAHAPERRARAACGPSCDRRLQELAWRLLEQELEPASRRIPGAAGGAW